MESTRNDPERLTFISEQIMRIDAAYRIETSQKHVEILVREWARSFDGFPDSALSWAVSQWIDSPAEFPPRLGQLRSRIICFLLDLKEPDEALRLVIWTVTRWHEKKFDTARDAMEFLDDVHVQAAARSVGWEDILDADTSAAKAAWKRQFIDAYERVISRVKVQSVERVAQMVDGDQQTLLAELSQ